MEKSNHISDRAAPRRFSAAAAVAILKRFSLLLNVLLLAALGTAVLANLYPPFRAALIVFLGRSTRCPLSQAIQVYHNPEVLAQLRARLATDSKLIQTGSEGLNLWDTPRGRFWIPAGSDSELLAMLAEQEQRIYGSGAQGVHPGDIVLDCGANVGVYTREALTEGAKTVVAIEPAVEDVACLRRTFEHEIAAGRVIVIDKGVWDREATLTLRGTYVNQGRDTFVLNPGPAPREHEAKVTTIDKIVAGLGLPRVDAIKMDIEGSEKQALNGAANTIARFKPRLSVASYHLPEDAEQIPALIQRLNPGYIYECGPCELSWYRLRPKVSYFR